MISTRRIVAAVGLAAGRRPRRTAGARRTPAHHARRAARRAEHAGHPHRR
ncbi:hypothetical protein LT493_02640 [Streptomyces tricolor]|nr:hypothetical protein [Streptomyces tricolor]